MAADFNKPVTTDNYADLLAMLRANQEVLARMFAGGITAANIPNGAVRFEAGKFQTWNGSWWVDVPVSVDGGGTGAQSALAARQALGTNDAANLTTGVMSADRVPGLDASKIVSGTLTRDTTGNAAGAPWSGITGKPAVIAAGANAADARAAIGATGNGLQLLWSGSSQSVDLKTLPGGYPGDGLYLFTVRSVNLQDYDVLAFLRAGSFSTIIYKIDTRVETGGDTRFHYLSVEPQSTVAANGLSWANGATFGQDTTLTRAIRSVYKII